MSLAIEHIAEPTVLDTAYEAVFKCRKSGNANDHLWHVAFHWETVKQRLLETLKAWGYQLSPMCYVKINVCTFGNSVDVQG